jgi:hypothetical protein
MAQKRPFPLTGTRAATASARKCRRLFFLGFFPMFVPSLSWQNDGILGMNGIATKPVSAFSYLQQNATLF